MIKKIADRQIKVLVIDDDIDVCQHLENFFSKNNFLVKYTTDPSTTISILRNEMFQIVILDLVMPGTNGIDLLKEIRKIDKHICVIILSGYPSFENAVKAFKNEAFDFVSKPFEKAEFLATIFNAIERYGLVSDLNQLATRQIARYLSALRKEKKFTYRQLASRSGLSPGLVYQIEHCKTSPSLATIARLATALGTPMENFFKGL